MDFSDDAPSQLGGSSVPLREPPRRNPTADFWIALCKHRALFDHIDKELTRGDIRLSFSGFRALIAKWLEQKVIKDEADCKAMMDKYNADTLDFYESDAQLDAEELFERSYRDLARYSQVFQDDRTAAMAPRASRHYLDAVMRHNIRSPDNECNCPNGEPIDFYGKRGDPPRPCFIAICDTESSVCGYIVQKLLNAFYAVLHDPVRKFLGKPKPEVQGIAQRTHDILVAGLEALSSCVFITGSIALSRIITSQTHQLIAMAVMSILFPFTVVFLSSTGKHIYVLGAAFWAVTVTLILKGSWTN